MRIPALLPSSPAQPTTAPLSQSPVFASFRDLNAPTDSFTPQKTNQPIFSGSRRSFLKGSVGAALVLPAALRAGDTPATNTPPLSVPPAPDMLTPAFLSYLADTKFKSDTDRLCFEDVFAAYQEWAKQAYKPEDLAKLDMKKMVRMYTPKQQFNAMVAIHATAGDSTTVTKANILEMRQFAEALQPFITDWQVAHVTRQVAPVDIDKINITVDKSVADRPEAVECLADLKLALAMYNQDPVGRLLLKNAVDKGFRFRLTALPRYTLAQTYSGFISIDPKPYPPDSSSPEALKQKRLSPIWFAHSLGHELVHVAANTPDSMFQEGVAEALPCGIQYRFSREASFPNPMMGAIQQIDHNAGKQMQVGDNALIPQLAKLGIISNNQALVATSSR